MRRRGDSIFWGILLMVAGVRLLMMVAESLTMPILNLGEMDIHVGHLVDAGNGGRGSSPWLTIRESDGSVTKYIVIYGKTSVLKELVNKPVTIWSQKERGAFLFTENHTRQVKHESGLVIDYEKDIRPGLEYSRAHRGPYYFFVVLGSLLIFISLFLFNSAKSKPDVSAG